MRLIVGPTLAMALFASSGFTQPPDRGGRSADDVKSFVAKMMAFDKNKDGKLTRDEITDERLLRLFDRADANKDGVVTPEELAALFGKEGGSANRSNGPGDGFGERRPADRAPTGPTRYPQVLPERLAEELDLTAEQKKQIADLQKEVETRLDRLLTRSQKAKLGENRGPGARP